MPEQKSVLNVVLGTMTFGAPGKEGTRVTEMKDIEAIIDLFQAHGHTEIDTARVYGQGTTEEYLGKTDYKKKGLKMETKLYPTITQPWAKAAGLVYSHAPQDLRKYVQESLTALNTSKLDIWYLHGPDRTTPYEDTLKAVNELYKEGLFDRFGISNFSAWEVAQIVTICRERGYIQPTVYEGIYNAVHRTVEPELFPCLKKFGLSFYEFNPLGGGFFTGRYVNADTKADAGSRFDPNGIIGKSHRGRYWNDHYFKALDIIHKAAEGAGLTMTEVALRWLSNHSLMKRDRGDSIIIGVSNLKHAEENLVDLEKGPLPDEVVKALDEAWLIVKPFASNYFH